MRRAAIYARYSTEEQRATSIEDQVRRTREKAISLGYEVPDELIFSDAIVTGQAKGLAKRHGYHRLIKAWDRGDFDALIVDESCRLAREPVEMAHLQVRIEKGNVRFISTDGIDSSIPGWQLQFGVCGVIAAHFVRETGHRVIRSMIGQLERGFMIAAAPYGYQMLRQSDEGTKWLIDEEKASRVRDIFQQRCRGASLASIAKKLNEQNIPSPRKSRNGTARYWRPATVRQMLQNTIYRGLFVWNGSPFSKAKAKRGETVLEPIDYPRPELRIVDDETWFWCNQPRDGFSIRGGDKHRFAGLVSCGQCSARLTVAAGGSSPSLYCAQCSQAEAVAVEGRKGGYVSAKAVEAVLTYAIEKVFSEDGIALFRERLKEKLEGGQDARIAEVKQAISKREVTLKRLIRLMSSKDTEDASLEDEYRLILLEKRKLTAELNALETSWANIDKASIKRQLEVDPHQLIPQLFSDEVSNEQARAALRRIFPKISRLGRTSRFCTQFEIVCAPGITVAEASRTSVIDDGILTMRYSVSGGAKRPSVWVVQELQ